ncbi:unnamed protein product [Calicophoron daubneyi]|uniref:Uncharacterized protein n=1 Tax=Calicophoron daubneyi TaxID=300641 RepID=A0AAV2TJ09_CALDB
MARIGSGVQMGLSWVPDQGGHVPDNAVEAGDEVYIGRMKESGDLIPGKIVPRNDKGYVCFGGKECEHTRYEVLCDTKAPGTSRCYEWEEDSDGHVPRRAVVGGVSSSGDPLYVARSRINGERVVGKVRHVGRSARLFEQSVIRPDLKQAVNPLESSRLDSSLYPYFRCTKAMIAPTSPMVARSTGRTAMKYSFGANESTGKTNVPSFFSVYACKCNKSVVNCNETPFLILLIE